MAPGFPLCNKFCATVEEIVDKKPFTYNTSPKECIPNF